jgi:hypothetical protein
MQMSKQPVRYYDYVNHRYARVRDALLANPGEVFRRATAATASDSATLHGRVGAVDVGAEVAIRITGVNTDSAFGVRATKIILEWSAVENPGLFPTMTATLSMFPLSSTETQLELEGSYTVPLGKLGATFDATLGHRLAEASVNRFIQEVARWLRDALAKPATATAAV